MVWRGRARPAAPVRSQLQGLRSCSPGAARIRELCEARVPPDALDEVRIFASVLALPWDAGRRGVIACMYAAGPASLAAGTVWSAR